MVNLNSLPVLREILRQGNIARAADILHLTPPALSNTLRQLRAYFDDDLIVREGRSMRLTPKGERLIVPLDMALNSMQHVLAEQEFAANAADDHFRIAMADHIMATLGAPLAEIIETEANDIGTHFITASRHSVADLLSGRIDMVISPRSTLTSGIADVATLNKVSTAHLVSASMVCIGRSDDCELKAGLSIEKYLTRPHVGFFLDAEQHLSAEQAHLIRLGHKQKNRLLVSSYAVLPQIVAKTGCISIIPHRLAIAASKIYPIQIVEPPIQFPDLDWTMVWLNRNDNRPALKWLIDALKRSVDDLHEHVAVDSRTLIAA
jgi:LysR family transcriptional regulator, nod-box dependent transcriptional activator